MRGDANQLTIGEKVRYYRRRRGLSQTTLAELAGKTLSWIEKIESGRAPLQVLPNISTLARILDISPKELLPDDILAVDDFSRGHSVPSLRQSLFSYRFVNPRFRSDVVAALTGSELELRVDRLWLQYQQGKLAHVIAGIDQTLPAAIATVEQSDGEAHRANTRQLAFLYQVAAAALSKIGEPDLACMCADRGESIAHDLDDEVVKMSLARSIAHALIANNQPLDAAEVVRFATADRATPHDADSVSVLGSLHLVGAMAAARLGDRDLARDHLGRAKALADQLGADANHVWTAFGPTNVAIHEVAVSGELSDYQRAVEIGTTLNIESLAPERRARHRLELARALHFTRRIEDAQDLVLQAERESAELVQRHVLTHSLLHEWLSNPRVKTTPRLHALATRAGILAS